MFCSRCKRELSFNAENKYIDFCPYCNTPVIYHHKNKKGVEIHAVLSEVVRQFGKWMLCSEMLLGMIMDIIPDLDNKYKRIFKQATADSIGSLLLKLETDPPAIQKIKLKKLRYNFKNDNAFDETVDYIFDCFLYALGWINTINSNRSDIGIEENLIMLKQQIYVAIADGRISSSESKAIFNISKSLGIDDSDVVDVLSAEIERLCLEPDSQISKPKQFTKEIICSCNWIEADTIQYSIPSFEGTYYVTDANIRKLDKGFEIYPENEIVNKTDKVYEGTYTGELCKSKPDGYGTLKHKTGKIIRGNFRNGFVDGVVFIFDIDGSEYYGSCKNGKRHGRGVLKNSDGSIYDGEWIDGKKNGEGSYSDSFGKKYVGEWSDDLLHGNVVCTNRNGTVSKTY